MIDRSDAPAMAAAVAWPARNEWPAYFAGSSPARWATFFTILATSMGANRPGFNWPWRLSERNTGPPVMPYLTFAGDQDHELAGVFAAQALRGGAYLHPRHNWFVSAAMTGDDLALALEATDQAFAAVRKHLGQ